MNLREHRVTGLPEPTDDLVRQEAHRIWLEEGCPRGRELEHWLAAKETLRHRSADRFEYRSRYWDDEVPEAGAALADASRTG